MNRTSRLLAFVSVASIIACQGAIPPPTDLPAPPPKEADSTAKTSANAKGKLKKSAKKRVAIDWDAALGDHRPAEDRARDGSRHPRETLEFFGLQGSMNVVELWPGEGWYTAILAKALKGHGKLGITAFPADFGSDMTQKHTAALDARLSGAPNVFGEVQKLVIAPPDSLSLGPDGSADMVVTFRNVHSFIKGKYADAVFQAAFRVLKPGGVLGVVEHRAKKDSPDDAVEKTGYVKEARVVALAEQAGFALDAASEINANDADTKDHPDGVWSLPPTLKGGQKDRAKFEKIGESDRMTLRFKKKASS